MKEKEESFILVLESEDKLVLNPLEPGWWMVNFLSYESMNDDDVIGEVSTEQLLKLKDFLNGIPDTREVQTSPGEGSNSRQDHG